MDIRSKKMLINTLIYGIGNFSSKFLTIMLLPIYTIYLTNEEYGYYDLNSVIITILIPIITLCLIDGVYRYLIDNNEKDNKIISTSFIFINLILFPSIILVYFILGIFKIDFNLLIIITLITDVYIAYFMQVARGLKYIKLYSISGIILTLITIFMNIFLIINLNLGVNSLFISKIISNIVVILFLEKKINIIKKIRIKEFEKKILNKMLKYSVPLIPNSITWWIMSVSDRFSINYFIGIGSVGIYAIANKFPNILIMINNIFYMAWQESLLSEYNSEDRDSFFSKTFNQYFKILMSLNLVIISITPLLFNVLIDISYEEAKYYIPILYFAIILQSLASFLGVIYQGNKKTSGAFYTSIIGALINIIINLIFISKFGLKIAAISTFISYLYLFIIRLYHTKRIINIKIDKKIFFILTLTNLFYSLMYYNSSKILNLLMFLISIILFIFINKNICINILKKVSSRIAI